MSEQDDPSRDRLKHHFAQRVTNQARQVLEVWQRLQRTEWNADTLAELDDASLRLLRYAERFEQVGHCQLAHAIQQCLEGVRANRGRLSSDLISELSQLIQRLSRTGLRHGDQLEQIALPALRKPVYLALQDLERCERLVQQLHSFGLNAIGCSTRAALLAACEERRPAALLIDLEFSGAQQGVAIVQELQKDQENRLPVLFCSDTEADTPTRLAAIRAGGEDFFCGNIDASSLLERIEQLTHITQDDPFRVLVVDDSRAQSTHAEMVLNSAGIITRTLNNPIDTLDALTEFQPDLIILDMYMPDCQGPELAKVIRQHERHVSVPIIFLSAEEDLDKQLDAMSEGGDDFLTKPIKPRHLIATVRTRAARARSLKARMVRDSLTGLYNHTHTLQLLEDSCRRGQRSGTPVSFAMLDIDHFKKVNDTYGHPMGDRVIKSLALFLKQRLRKTDHIGRYGGEEFAVVLPDTDQHTAWRLLDEIRQRFAEIHFPTGQHDLHCTFSSGIAELETGVDARTLSKRADEALYVSKHGGRNRVSIFQGEPTLS